jgi:hypothetical protein
MTEWYITKMAPEPILYVKPQLKPIIRRAGRGMAAMHMRRLQPSGVKAFISLF